MLSSSRARFAYVLVLLAAFAGVLGLGFVVLGAAIAAGTAEGWMMGGILLVVIGLPVGMLLLPVANWLRQRARAWSIVPNAGENVQGAGQ